MKLSILIPAYNPGKRLRGLLEQLKAQITEYPNVEIIVIDDGSDEDICWVKEYPSVRYKRQKNGGEGNARNALLKMAKGEYIQFLDADDEIFGNCLSVIFGNINAGYDWVSYDWVCDGSKEAAYQNKGILMVNCAVWAYTFRKSFIGGVKFDETLKTGCDQVWLKQVLTDESKHRHDNSVFYNYLWMENVNSLCHKKARGEI